MANIVIVDLDGTLANGEDREREHLRQSPKQWKEYFDKCHEDTPHEDMIEMINQLAENFLVVILTGRIEETRQVTEDWLEKHEVTYHMLIMRPPGNRVDDDEWKLEIGRLFGLHNILCVYEDRSRVVEAWREAGVRCIQVASGDF